MWEFYLYLSMDFEPKTIKHLKEYGTYAITLTVSIYTNKKNIGFEAIDTYKPKGLILTGASFVRYENNPLFKTEAKMHTTLSAN